MEAVKVRLNIFLGIFLCITTIGTFGFMFLEKLTFTDALYYNIVTMSTVGYGDIHPTNQAQDSSPSFSLLWEGGLF